MKGDVYSSILTTFFTIEAVLNALEIEADNIFSEIAAMFGLKEGNEVSALFALTELPFVKSADFSVRNAKIDKKFRAFSHIGADVGLQEREKWALLCKANSFKKLEASKLLSENTSDYLDMISTVQTSASSGDITAITVLGFLLLNGFGVKKDAALAIKMLTDGEEWGSLECILMLLHFDKTEEKSSQEHLAFFKAFCDKSIRWELYDSIARAYPKLFDTEPKKEAQLIKAVRSSYSFKDKESSTDDRVFDGQVARIAYSSKLSYVVKSRVLLSGNRARISHVNELPLDNIPFVQKLQYDAFAALPPKRKVEAENIWRKLAAFDNLKKKCIKHPLLLVCPDKYVLNLYRDVIAAALGCTACIERDLSAVTKEDLEQNKNNLFIRTMIENSSQYPLYVFKHAEDLSADESVMFADQLHLKNRQFFVLSELDISFDFSEIVLLLTATEMPHKSVVSSCNVIELARVTDSAEKEQAYASALKRLREIYRTLPTISDEMKAAICTHSVNRMMDILVEICEDAYASEVRGDEFVLTDKLVKSLADRMAVPAFGFAKKQGG